MKKDLAGDSHLYYVARSIINLSDFSFVPTGYFYGCFVTLNFTKWLKFFNLISLEEHNSWLYEANLQFPR